MSKRVQGFLIGFALVLAIKYLLLGEERWNELWADFHRELPGNIKDELGNP